MNGKTLSNLWLIGASPMAQDYAHVLKKLDVHFKVIGRGEGSAKGFESGLGIPVQTGGVETALQNEAPPETAIVAVGVEQLSSVARKLIQAGTKRILLEKPGGMTLDELQNLNSEVQSNLSKHYVEVWLAYNRRFYEATRKTREIILADGSPRGSYRYKGICNVFDSLPTEFLFTSVDNTRLTNLIDQVLEAEQEEELRIDISTQDRSDTIFVLMALPRIHWSDDKTPEIINILKID